jgi:hypothetical protein
MWVISSNEPNGSRLGANGVERFCCLGELIEQMALLGLCARNKLDRVPDCQHFRIAAREVCSEAVTSHRTEVILGIGRCVIPCVELAREPVVRVEGNAEPLGDLCLPRVIGNSD